MEIGIDNLSRDRHQVLSRVKQTGGHNVNTHHRTRQRTTEGNVFNLQQQPSAPLASPSPHTRRPARPRLLEVDTTDGYLADQSRCAVDSQEELQNNEAFSQSCHEYQLPFLPLSLAVAGQAHISIPPAMSFISSSATLRLRPSSDPCSPPPPTPSPVICALPQKPPTGHRQQDAPCHRPSLMTTKDKGPRRRGESPEKGRKRATAKV